MVKTRTWVIGLAAAALLLGAATWYTLSARRESNVVQIIQGDVVVQEIDLARVAKAYSFTIDAPGGGSNTVTVEPGRICVSEADCPDQVCVMQGWLSDQAMPIVCLPHQLIILLKDVDPGGDAVAR